MEEGHLLSHWLVVDEDGVIYGVAGQECGGYTAFIKDEWLGMGGEIQEATREWEAELARYEAMPLTPAATTGINGARAVLRDLAELAKLAETAKGELWPS